MEGILSVFRGPIELGLKQDQWFSWHISSDTARSPTVKFRFARMVWGSSLSREDGLHPPEIHHILFLRRNGFQRKEHVKSQEQNT